MSAWTQEYVAKAKPTNVAEMQEAMRLASLHNIDCMDALAMIRRDQYQFEEMMDGRMCDANQ